MPRNCSAARRSAGRQHPALSFRAPPFRTPRAAVFCATLGSLATAFAFVAASLLTSAAQAQPGATPAAGKSGNAKTGGATTGNAKTGDLKESSQPESPLPRDFVPPREIPAVMKLEKPLLTAAEWKKLTKELNVEKFPQALRNGDRSQQATLKKGAAVSIKMLSVEPEDELAARKAEIEQKYDDRIKRAKKDEDKEKLKQEKEDEIEKELEKPTVRAELAQERDRLVREINNAGALLEPKAAREFRAFYMKEVVDQAKLLLDGNFYVRLNAIMLLSELNVAPDEPFVDAVRPLLDVVASKDQPEALKITALLGIRRFVQSGKGDPPLKLKITETLVSELKRREIHWWYQMRLADVLGHVETVVDLNQNPIVAQVLMETMVDESRHCAARTEAAKALGRNSLQGGVNASLIAFEVAHLAQDLANKHNNDVKNQVVNPFTKQCFVNLYLAFKPVDAAAEARGDGLYNKVQKLAFAKHKPMVEEAYKHTLSLVNQVFPAREPTLIPDGILTPVTDWLKKSQPADDRLAPGLPLYKPSSPVVDNSKTPTS